MTSFKALFFHRTTTSLRRYKKNPPGELNPIKLIEGRPAYLDKRMSDEYQRKTIILADWRSRFTERDADELKNKLLDLLEQGFEIYYLEHTSFEQKKVKLLTQDLLLEMDEKAIYQLGNISAARVQGEGPEALAQLPSYQVLVLDDHWMSCTLEGNFELPRVLRISEGSLREPRQEVALKSTVANLKKASPLLSQIEVIDYGPMSEALQPLRLEKNVEGVPVVYNIRKVRHLDKDLFAYLGPSPFFNVESVFLSEDSWQNRDLFKTLLMQAPNLRTLTYLWNVRNGIDFFHEILPNLENLQALTLNLADIRESEFIDLMRLLPALKVFKAYIDEDESINLTISEEASTQALSALGVSSFPSLKTLDLSDSDVNLTVLNFLLSLSPSLERLYLNSYKGKFENGELRPPYPLEHLKKLDLLECEIDRESLFNLLSQALRLERLVLTELEIDCAKENEAESFSSDHTVGLFYDEAESCPLENLQFLDVSGSGIDGTTLSNMIVKASKLEMLLLNQCENIVEIPALEICDFKYLKELNLTDSAISSSSFMQLMHAAPNLESLLLENCEGINNPNVFKFCSLPHLETLVISGSSLSGDELPVLDGFAPSLDELTIKNGKKMDSENPCGGFDVYRRLTTLNIQMTEMSLEFLNMLDNHASLCNQLETLTLFGCTGLRASDSTMDMASYKNLETLDLYDCDITGINLTYLLYKAPNLKLLSLQDCGFLDEYKPFDPDKDDSDEFPNLNHLQKLTVSCCSIETDLLIEMLEHCPELAILEIVGCSNLDREDPRLCALLKTIPIFHDTPNPQKKRKVSPPEKNHKKSEYVDADTASSSSAYKVQRVFFSANGAADPEVNMVRMDIYDSMTVNPNVCSPSHAFQLHQNEDLALQSHRPEALSSDAFETAKQLNTSDSQNTYFYGKQTLKLDADGWQPLASLSPNEYLTHYHVSPEGGALEFAYSLTRSQYFIRSLSGPQTIELDFVVAVPFQASLGQQDDIQDLVNYYLSFQPGALVQKDERCTGIDYLNAMIDQQVGACRHRAVAFFYQMISRGILCRIILNNMHAFVEVFKNGQWYMLNLGGYPAAVMIDESARPGQVFSNSKNKKFIQFDGQASHEDLLESYKKDFAIGETEDHSAASPLAYVFDILNVDAPSKQLIECQSEDDLHALRAMMQLHANRPVFYISNPDDLSCSVSSIKRDSENRGIICKPPSGALFDFIQNQPDGVLLIDFSAFDAEEIVQCMALFDEIPSLDGEPIPSSLKRVGLVNINDPDCSLVDFSRFEGNIKKCPLRQADFLKDEPRLATAHAALHETETVVSAQAPLRVDLHHSPDWFELLCGKWVIDGNELYFVPGALANLQPGQPIEFINALWRDKQFRQFVIDIQSTGVLHPARLIQDINPRLLVSDYENPMLGSEPGDSNYNVWNPLETSPLVEYPEFAGYEFFPSQFPMDTALNFASSSDVFMMPASGLDVLEPFDAALLDWEANVQAPGFDVGAAHAPNNDEIFLLSDNAIYKSEGYSWSTLLSGLILMPQKTEGATFCNPTLFQQCLSRYNIEDGLLYKQPGWVEQSQETGVLNLHFTRSLSEDEWGILLTEAQKQGVTIQASIAPGVELPEFFSDYVEIPETKQPLLRGWQASMVHPSATQTIISTDINTTVLQLTQDNEDWLVFDISECEPSDLLIETKAKFDEEQGHFHFSEKKRLLYKALEAHKNIILKGAFSDELKDSLAPFLDEREQPPGAPGRLLLVTENDKDFSDMRSRAYHEVEVSEKINLLKGPDEENIKYVEYLRAYLEQESLAQLQARLRYLKTQIAAGENLESLDSDNAWIGLRTLPQQTEAMDTFDFKTSEQEAHDFMQKRLNSVHQVLSQSPYVFLSGPTGSGKTTFVEQYIGQLDERTLYIGEEQLKAFATDDSENLKILFIDEANLAHKDWTVFEGLLQQPPVLLIGGKPYFLTPRHKIIFAGNPVSYGDERKLSSLFEAHGSALYFEPLSKAVIYENILKPVFAHTSLPSETVEAICADILTLYDFIKSISQHEVLISPRELQAMALLIQAAARTQTDVYGASGSAPSIDSRTIQRITWQYAKQWIPKEHQHAFDKAFKPKLTIDKSRIDIRNDFIITPSRQPFVQQMDEWLALRQWRIEEQGDLSEAQCFGGLGGIIVKGEPGIGKTDIVIHNLIHHGYQEVHNMEIPATGNIFYRIPASLSLSEKETRLRKAFHEGAVVVMDEIPMMERLMNSLLMGKTPEGERPNRPGFFVIGTQNPASMAGHRAVSHALGHRMHTTQLDSYPEDEMISILKHKGIEQNHANAMVKAFLIQNKRAVQHHGKPLNFRDLLARAKQYLQAKQRSESTAAEPLEALPMEVSAGRPGRSRDTLFNRRRPPSDDEEEPELKRPKPG